jgi:hypothetical protein
MTMLAMGVPRDYQRTKFARSAREVQMHLKFKPWGSRRVSSLRSNVKPIRPRSPQEPSESLARFRTSWSNDSAA